MKNFFKNIKISVDIPRNEWYYNINNKKGGNQMKKRRRRKKGDQDDIIKLLILITAILNLIATVVELINKILG